MASTQSSNALVGKCLKCNHAVTYGNYLKRGFFSGKYICQQCGQEYSDATSPASAGLVFAIVYFLNRTLFRDAFDTVEGAIGLFLIWTGILLLVGYRYFSKYFK